MSNLPIKSPLQDWSRLQVMLAWVREGGVAPVGHGRKNRRELNAAWLVLRGKARAFGDGWEAEAGPGQWLIPHPDPHEQYFSDDIHLLSVRFQAVWPDGSYLWEQGLGLVVDAAEAPELEPCARHLLDLRRRYLPESDAFGAFLTPTDAHGFFQLQRELFLWLDVFGNALADRGVTPHIPSTGDPRIYHAIELFEAGLGSPGLDLDAVAYAVGLSLRQLDRIFLETIGLTANQQLQRMRITRAKERLESSPTPVKEIGYDLGFRSPSHFTTWFRRQSGLTPRQFRKQSL